MARFGGDLRIDKKGAIDLVTEMDLEIERAFRTMIAERFPDHAVLGEEFEESGDRAARPRFCWVLDPIDGTTNYAHGLPIFCASLALEIDGVAVVGCGLRSEPTRAVHGGEGRTARGSTARRCGCRAPRTLIDSLLVTGFHYDIHRDSSELIELFGEFISRARAVRRPRLGRARPLLRRRGTLRRVLGAQAAALGRRRRCTDRRGSRRDA